MAQSVTRAVLCVVGVSLAVTAVGQWSARQQVERQYAIALKARKALELELGELRADRERIAGVLSTEQQRVATLSTTLAEKDAQQHDIMDRLFQEERIIQELQGRLLAMQLQFDRLQGEFATTLQGRAGGRPSPGNKTVQLEKVVVTHSMSSSTAPGLRGRVISVNPQWRFVVIDMGWDVVNIGDVVSIYRSDHLLGKARVERVQEQVSAATLLPESTESEVQVNDVVRVL